MGPKDMEEIGEEEIFDDFAEALQLRPLERRCEFTERARWMAYGPNNTSWRHVMSISDATSRS